MRNTQPSSSEEENDAGGIKVAHWINLGKDLCAIVLATNERSGRPPIKEPPIHLHARLKDFGPFLYIGFHQNMVASNLDEENFPLFRLCSRFMESKSCTSVRNCLRPLRHYIARCLVQKDN